MGELRENLQHNLGYFLSRKGLSQKDFAEKLGVSQSAVTNWIRGNNSPDIELVSNICDVLNISVLDLMNKPTDKVEPEENIEVRAEKLYKALIYAGFIDEGQDLSKDTRLFYWCCPNYQRLSG